MVADEEEQEVCSFDRIDRLITNSGTSQWTRPAFTAKTAFKCIIYLSVAGIHLLYNGSY